MINGLNVTEEEAEKTRKLLKNSIEMFENTKKETERIMRNALDTNGKKMYDKKDIDSRLELIEKEEQESIAKYKLFGGDVNDLKINKQSKADESGMPNLFDNSDFEFDLNKYLSNKETALSDTIEREKKTVIVEEEPVNIKQEASDDSFDIMSVNENDLSLPDTVNMSSNEAFDIIPLPSNGECYPNKVKKIPVSYLTANDENIIVSPNLYRDNLIIDYLIKKKTNLDIDPLDLVEGDREAIIMFLRASGYGNEYPVSVKDNITGERYETNIDLSTLKYKDFKLTGDENGWFDYTLPLTKKKVKFRFLTHRDVLKLQKAEEVENGKLTKIRLDICVKDLDYLIEHDDTIEAAEKVKIRQSIREIEKWHDMIDEEKTSSYTHLVTNNLELAIMDIDGNRDRKYIREFVRNMPTRDSSSLRKYISDNKPGVNFEFEVQKPESLGGGSQKVFLQFGQDIFYNISE